MASSTRLSLSLSSSSKAAAAASSSAKANNTVVAAAPKTFHGSKFFDVLGRIDEESSFRASIGNMASRDNLSQDYSTSSSDEGSTEFWAMPLSPSEQRSSSSSSHGNHINGDDDDEEKEIDEPTTSIPIHDTQSHGNETNEPAAVILANARYTNHPALDAASAERRQDQSSPIVSLSSSSDAQRGVMRNTQQHQHGDHRDQEQHRQRQSQHQQMARQHQENEALLQECEELESTILQLRNEGNLLQMRTSIRLRNYQAEIERSTREKQALEEDSRGLEDQIRNLRNETQHKQESILHAEEVLKERRVWQLREAREREREQQNRYRGSKPHKHSKHTHQHQHEHRNFGMKTGTAWEG